MFCLFSRPKHLCPDTQYRETDNTKIASSSSIDGGMEEEERSWWRVTLGVMEGVVGPVIEDVWDRMMEGVNPFHLGQWYKKINT